MYLIPKTTFKQRLFSSSGLAFLTMLVWEGVESLLEYAIAYFISSAITLLAVKLLTTFLIVTLTQTMLNKLQRFTMTFVKKLTYKKGEDKVDKLKKIWELIKTNKLSLIAVTGALLLTLSGTKVIDISGLPAIELGSETVVEAVIQEEDLIATEDIYSEPVYATEDVYSEPVLADKLTMIAIQVIYADDGSTIKYNVGDVIDNADFFKYASQVAVYNVGDIIKPAELLYKAGDEIEPAKLLYKVGDVITPAGTVLEEAYVVPPVNATPYIYYILLGLATGSAGAFFEGIEQYKRRKKEDALIKVAKKELAAENKKAVQEQTQKALTAQKAKDDEAYRLDIEKYKEAIKSGNL